MNQRNSKESHANFAHRHRWGDGPAECVKDCGKATQVGANQKPSGFYGAEPGLILVLVVLDALAKPGIVRQIHKQRRLSVRIVKKIADQAGEEALVAVTLRPVSVRAALD